MNRTTVVVMGLVVFLAVCALLRRPRVEGTPLSRAERSEPQIAIPSEPQPAFLVGVLPETVRTSSVGAKAGLRADQEQQREFWDRLTVLTELRSSSVDPERDRATMIAETSRHLGLIHPQSVAFEQTALQAVLLIREAWKIRDASLLSLSPSLEGEERRRKEQETEERYEDAKRLEIRRIEATLDDRLRHVLFRERLAEWIDAVR